MRRRVANAGIGDVERVDPDTDVRVLRERLRMALRGLGPNYVGAVVVSALSVWVLWDEMSHRLLLLWLAYMLLTTAVRAVLGHRDARRLETTDDAPPLMAFYGATLAAGIGWGALGTFLPMPHASDSRALVAVVLAGVTAGSAPNYALLLPAARLFLCAALLPAIVFFLPAGNHIDTVIGTMIACYLAITLRNAAMLYRNLGDALALRFENTAIVDKLLASRQVADALNESLRGRIHQHEADQRALILARDAAEGAALAKSEFLANMSHEIRTPETYDVLGLPRSVAIGELNELARLAIVEDRDRVEVAFAEALRHGNSFNLEFRIAGSSSEVRNLYVVALAENVIDAGPRFIGTLQDISERRRAEQQIHQLAYFDAVTGLPNRASIRARLVQALALAKRNERSVAVLSIDLDHFQRINDTLGFASGNELLRAIGERFRAVLRASDSVNHLTDTLTLETVGRAAGDEFIALLPYIANAEDAAVIARRLRSALNEPFEIADQEIYARTSIGISVFPDDGSSADDLLKHADSALAQAKREGRDCYQFFTAALNARAFKRLTVEMHLRRALDRDQFMVYFQPKLRASDLALVGFEALVRWLHPELGRVSPAEFIPVAEETGLIVPIGEWVLASAARQLAEWDWAGRRAVRCAVNLSAMQFHVKDLHQRLAKVVSDSGIEPSRIDLELTESVLMEDGQAAIRTLHELKSHGFGIAVDDFGTGYSSLSYLKRLPIDVLKIDQSFVHELRTGGEDAAIVSTIISMARSLNLKVVAEGVEQQAQLDFLRAQGCDELQGYFFSPPLPAADIAAWVDQHEATAAG